MVAMRLWGFGASGGEGGGQLVYSRWNGQGVSFECEVFVELQAVATAGNDG